jgi:Chaperone of endosialidase
MGAGALGANTTGNDNTATGFQALFNNLASGNTAHGYQALLSNIGGSSNTATGYQALSENTANANTANGSEALVRNTTGCCNTATGDEALGFNTTGASNTAIGYHALAVNSTGDDNTAVGAFAGTNVSTADNVICIRAAGQNVSNSCYIGNIWNQPGGSQAVYVNSDGKLGAQVSSERFKDEIKPMDKSSEALFALRPVKFHYKREIDRGGTEQFGLVAEDVEKVNPDLVIRDEEGKPYSVRYDQVNAMLLNEFLKEHRKVQKLEATVADLKTAKAREDSAISDLRNEVRALTAQLKAQTEHMQKVRAQIKTRNAGSDLALNRP